MVATVNQVAKVHYGKIVDAIVSKSAGPDIRAKTYRPITIRSIIDLPVLLSWTSRI